MILLGLNSSWKVGSRYGRTDRYFCAKVDSWALDKSQEGGCVTKETEFARFDTLILLSNHHNRLELLSSA